MSLNMYQMEAQYEEVCRLCSTSEGILTLHIYDEEGQNRQILSLIQTCLSVTVSKDDSLPKYVCHRCLHKLEMCFEFQLSCIKSEAVLRHRINVEQNSAKSNKPRKAKAVSIEENEDEVQIIDSAEFVATDLDMHVERCDDSFGADNDNAKVDGLEDVAKRRETLLMDDAGGEAKSINTLLREAAESITEPTNPAQLSQTEKRLDKRAFALQRRNVSKKSQRGWSIRDKTRLITTRCRRVKLVKRNTGTQTFSKTSQVKLIEENGRLNRNVPKISETYEKDVLRSKRSLNTGGVEDVTFIKTMAKCKRQKTCDDLSRDSLISDASEKIASSVNGPTSSTQNEEIYTDNNNTIKATNTELEQMATVKALPVIKLISRSSSLNEQMQTNRGSNNITTKADNTVTEQAGNMKDVPVIESYYKSSVFSQNEQMQTQVRNSSVRRSPTNLNTHPEQVINLKVLNNITQATKMGLHPKIREKQVTKQTKFVENIPTPSVLEQSCAQGTNQIVCLTMSDDKIQTDVGNTACDTEHSDDNSQLSLDPNTGLLSKQLKSLTNTNSLVTILKANIELKNANTIKECIEKQNQNNASPPKPCDQVTDRKLFTNPLTTISPHKNNQTTADDNQQSNRGSEFSSDEALSIVYESILPLKPLPDGQSRKKGAITIGNIGNKGSKEASQESFYKHASYENTVANESLSDIQSSDIIVLATSQKSHQQSVITYRNSSNKLLINENISTANAMPQSKSVKTVALDNPDNEQSNTIPGKVSSITNKQNSILEPTSNFQTENVIAMMNNTISNNFIKVIRKSSTPILKVTQNKLEENTCVKSPTSASELSPDNVIKQCLLPKTSSHSPQNQLSCEENLINEQVAKIWVRNIDTMKVNENTASQHSNSSGQNSVIKSTQAQPLIENTLRTEQKEKLLIENVAKMAVVESKERLKSSCTGKNTPPKASRNKTVLMSEKTPIIQGQDTSLRHGCTVTSKSLDSSQNSLSAEELEFKMRSFSALANEISSTNHPKYLVHLRKGKIRAQPSSTAISPRSPINLSASVNIKNTSPIKHIAKPHQSKDKPSVIDDNCTEISDDLIITGDLKRKALALLSTGSKKKDLTNISSIKTVGTSSLDHTRSTQYSMLPLTVDKAASSIVEQCLLSSAVLKQPELCLPPKTPPLNQAHTKSSKAYLNFKSVKHMLGTSDRWKGKGFINCHKLKSPPIKTYDPKSTPAQNRPINTVAKLIQKTDRSAETIPSRKMEIIANNIPSRCEYVLLPVSSNKDRSGAIFYAQSDDAHDGPFTNQTSRPDGDWTQVDKNSSTSQAPNNASIILDKVRNAIKMKMKATVEEPIKPALPDCISRPPRMLRSSSRKPEQMLEGMGFFTN